MPEQKDVRSILTPQLITDELTKLSTLTESLKTETKNTLQPSRLARWTGAYTVYDGESQKLQNLFSPSILHEHPNTIRLYVNQLAEKRDVIPIDAITITGFTKNITTPDSESPLDYYYSSTNLIKNKLCMYVNLFFLSLRLRQHLEASKDLLEQLFTHPLEINPDFSTKLRPDHKTLILTCIHFQSLSKNYHGYNFKRAEELEPAEDKALMQDLATLNGPNPFIQLQETAPEIVESVLQTKQLTLLLEFYHRSQEAKEFPDILKQIRVPFNFFSTEYQYPSILFPPQTEESKGHLQSFLDRCHTSLKRDRGPEEQIRDSLGEDKHLDCSSKQCESLHAFFHETNTSNPLLRASTTINILSLLQHAENLIKEAEPLSESKKKGYSYAAMGYRKGIQILRYLKLLCVNYEKGWGPFLAALRVKHLKRCTYIGKTSEDKRLITEGRPWLLSTGKSGSSTNTLFESWFALIRTAEREHEIEQMKSEEDEQKGQTEELRSN